MCGGACVGKYHRLGRGCSASELFHKRVRALVLSSFGLSESEYFHKQTRLGPKLLAAQQRLTIYFLLDSPPVRDMVESMSEGHGVCACERHLRASECSMVMAGNARKKLEWMFFYKTRSAWTDGGAMSMPLLCKGWLLFRITSFGRTRQ